MVNNTGFSGIDICDGTVAGPVAGDQFKLYGDILRRDDCCTAAAARCCIQSDEQFHQMSRSLAVLRSVCRWRFAAVLSFCKFQTCSAVNDSITTPLQAQLDPE